jgi:hypothetical protein
LQREGVHAQRDAQVDEEASATKYSTGRVTHNGQWNIARHILGNAQIGLVTKRWYVPLAAGASYARYFEQQRRRSREM